VGKEEHIPIARACTNTRSTIIGSVFYELLVVFASSVFAVHSHLLYISTSQDRISEYPVVYYCNVGVGIP
jgi:hypothetical protein